MFGPFVPLQQSQFHSMVKRYLKFFLYNFASRHFGTDSVSCFLQKNVQDPRTMQPITSWLVNILSYLA